MSARATAVVTNIAVPGVPPALTDAVRPQISRSRPVAKRLRVPIIMMALSSGGSETIESTVMSRPPRSPMSTCAASAAGRIDAESCDIGRRARSATLTRR